MANLSQSTIRFQLLFLLKGVQNIQADQEGILRLWDHIYYKSRIKLKAYEELSLDASLINWEDQLHIPTSQQLQKHLRPVLPT